MPHDSWETYVDTGSPIQPDENIRQLHDNGRELWHTEAGTLQQDYNDIRASEIKKREDKIIHNVIHFYFSRNCLIVIFISLVLSLVTSTFSLEGLFLWNIVLGGFVWVYFQLTVRNEVRSEWNEIWEEIDTM